MATYQKNFVVKNGLEVGLLGGNTLFASGGKVGVGSTTPVRTFDVSGSAAISDDLYVDGTTYSGNVTSNNALSVAGFSTFGGSVQVRGNLEIQGTQFIVNTEEVRIEDKNITLGFSTQIAPSDFYSSGGGFEIAGSVDTSILPGIGTNSFYKSFVWYDKTYPLFVSNQRVGIGTSIATNAAYLDVGGTVQFVTNENWDLRVNGRSKLTGYTEIDNLSFSGIASVSQISVGSSLGTEFQYIRKNSTNTELEWASFPALRTVESFVAISGQTVFTPAVEYNIGFIDVYLNGVRLSSSEFVATNGTSVTLSAAAFDGDLVDLIIYAPEAGGVASTIILEELSWKPTDEPNGIYTSGSVSIGTSESYGKLTVDGSARFSGPVSIGTTAFFPTTDLLVNDNSGHPNIWLTAGPDVAGDDFRIGLTLADDGHAYLSTNDNIDLNFAVGGGVTSHVVIKEDGKVGIGSTLPSGKLDVEGTVNATAFVGDGSGLFGVIAASGGINLLDHGVSAGLAATVNIDGNLSISPASSGVATIFYNDTNSQWITVAAGLHTTSNVGIGTDDPTSKLTVDGDVLITGIATFGTSSITIDGNNNLINVGTGITINGNAGIISATEFYANGIPLGGAKVTISETAPSSPLEGNLWFSSLAGRGFIWYSDGDSSQWVDFSPAPGSFDLPWVQENEIVTTPFKVGIGTTTTDKFLTVNGDSKFIGTSHLEGPVYEHVINDFSTNIPITSNVFEIDTSKSNVIVGVATTSISTWDFVNVDSNNSISITITLFLDSDATFTYGDNCNVNGSPVSGGISWSGSLPPVPSNNTDILTFTLIRDDSGTMKVFGSGSTNYF